MLSLAIRTASSSSRNVSTVSTGPNDSSWTTDMPAVAAVEHGRQVVEAVGQRGVVGPARRRSAARRPRRARRDVRLDLLAVRGGDQRAGLGLVVERAAEPDPLGAADELVDELVVDRLLDDQPGTGRAHLARVQEHRGQREVERGLAVGVGEHDVGVLAAQLERDLLHRLGGRGHDPLAGGQAAGERDQVDAGVLAEQGTRARAGAEHEVGDAGGDAGLRRAAASAGSRCAG